MYPNTHFTKENISRRITRRSAELWGYDESQIDQFDPLVKLLIEACSVEFEKVGKEIEETELRLMTRLAEVLSPESHSNPQPSVAIAQARSLEAIGWIAPENQLVYKRNGARKGEAAEIFFSPTGKFSLVNAAVSHYATPGRLYAIEKGTRNLLSEARGQTGGEQSVWIGLEMDPNMTSWSGFRFFVDWLNDSGQSGYRDFLPGTVWEVNDKPLEMEIGLNPENGPDNLPLMGYEQNFVQITGSETWEKGKILTRNYPAEFEDRFDRRQLQSLKAQLVWVRVKWSAAFPAAGFENMIISINAFPVQNKQLHKLTYRLQPGLNGVALPSGDAFIGIHSVINQKSQLYTASEKNLYNTDDNAARIYTLRRQGVGRFDQRNAKAMLYQLMELLRDEVTAFNAIGEDFLASILREIAQNMARIEQKLGVKKAAETTAQPFLVIRGEKTPDLLYISYWTTLAEASNGLPPGSKLNPYAASSVSNNDVMLLTRSTGGKPRPDEAEYVDQLRKNIITRNRLVTLEDFRAYCTAELGSLVKDVQVKPHFAQSNLPGQGFVRCLQIQLTPSNPATDREEWSRTCDLLRMKTEKLSTGMYPIQIAIRA